MKLKNNQIYKYNEALLKFTECDIKMPVRISFFLQKNIQKIRAMAEEIEIARVSIAQRFGILNEDGTKYQISPQYVIQVEQELNDLFNIEQEVNLHIFKLEDFEGIELTYQEMSAIMFMIEE